MKPLPLLLLALFTLIPMMHLFPQNLRSEVALVRPQLSQEARSGFLEIANGLSRQGYTDLAGYFRSWAGGGHGSGVLVQSPDGSTVLITNRHVAAFSQAADVSFHNLDGTEVVWPGCPVLYTDPFVDIAVIGIPANAEVQALRISSEIAEGMDVWSAGFPGLEGRPEWQLAKGTLTNASVVIPELGREDDAVFYQHSAPIDPGNSGGPLLVGDPLKPSSLKVVGINSYSVRSRSNTFFSVPATKIQEALRRFSSRGNGTAAAASKALAVFLNKSEWDKFAYREFISYHLASKAGWSQLQAASKTMTNKEWSIWYNRFVDSPLDALAQFLSYQLWQRVRSASGNFVYVSTDGSDDPVSLFSLERDQVKITWVTEAGSWKVSDVDAKGFSTQSMPPQPAELPTPTGPSWSLGATIPVADSWDPDIGFALSSNGESKLFAPLTLVTHLGFSQDSPTKSDFASHPPATKYNVLEVGAGVRYYGLAVPSSGAYWAPFGQLAAHAVFALPMLQNSFLASLGSNSTLAPKMIFLFAGVLEPKIGLEGSFDGRLVFGIDAGMRWFLFGLSGIKTVPVEVYVKLCDLG